MTNATIRIGRQGPGFWDVFFLEGVYFVVEGVFDPFRPNKS